MTAGAGGGASDDQRPGGRPVRPPRREAALWGLVGALVFLVLHQGYLLAGGRFLGVVPVGFVTAVVGAGVAGIALVLTRNGQR